MSQDPYAAAQASAGRLAALTGQPAHDVAVVLGSGWAPAADALAAALGASVTEVKVADLGGFPAPTVAGHAGTVRSLAVPVAQPGAAGQGSSGGPVAGPGQRVLVFVGRVHLYEGHPVPVLVHGVRTAIAAGCRAVVLTNAAGGIREGFAVGQPVLLADHLNLTGESPLAGPPPPAGYPSRFTDLTDLYSPRIRAVARAADPGLAEGVYAALPGPHYETPAEIRMLRALGADLVGMSTALEAIAARHLGAEVAGISLVSNLAAGLSGSGLDHAEVVEAGRAAAGRMGTLLAGILPQVASP
ncbi:MAG TPA: purine-nucleoside phosphorylase [Streptosporangiaceae bacterium]|nr:purine-nucleoside phosphorylase [Streptosporangiaceae bacterium]